MSTSPMMAPRGRSGGITDPGGVSVSTFWPAWIQILWGKTIVLGFHDLISMVLSPFTMRLAHG